MIAVVREGGEEDGGGGGEGLEREGKGEGKLFLLFHPSLFIFLLSPPDRTYVRTSKRGGFLLNHTSRVLVDRPINLP